MTIKEIEERSGLQRASIRFYERNGLITPERMSNKYREYSNSDLEELFRIKLFRSLGVSIEEIKEMQSGETSVDIILKRQIEKIQQAQGDMIYAGKMCSIINASNTEYSKLDGEKYIKYTLPDEAESKSLSVYEEVPTEKPVFWRRIFARYTDMSLYLSAWILVLKFFLKVNIYALPKFGRISLGDNISFTLPGWLIYDDLMWFILTISVMLIIEPFMLCFFGATLGKWIFGLRVTDRSGGKPSYRESLVRSISLLWYGYGFGISPVITLVMAIKSLKSLKNDEAEWDLNLWLNETRADTKLQNGVILTAVWAVVIALQIIPDSYNTVPPNRGEITIEQFAENFNYISAKYYGEYFAENSSECINPYGEWNASRNFPITKAHFSGKNYYYGFSYGIRPHFCYTLGENQILKSMEIIIEADDQAENPIIIYGMNNFIMTTVQAYAVNENNAIPTSELMRDIEDIIKELDTFSDFSFTVNNTLIKYFVEYEGYYYDRDNNVLRSSDDAENLSFSCTLVQEKLTEY